MSVPQDKPLPQIVVKRQTELLTRIHNCKALLPQFASSSKVLGELDAISRTAITNDKCGCFLLPLPSRLAFREFFNTVNKTRQDTTEENKKKLIERDQALQEAEEQHNTEASERE